MKKFLCVWLCLVALSSNMAAQNALGTWHGILTNGQQTSRLILQLSRENDGRIIAALFNLDQGGFGAPAVAFSTTLNGQIFKAQFGRGAFDGTVAENGTAIRGTWTPTGTGRGPAPSPQPLVFSRPSAATAWRDSSAHKVRFVPVEPNVKLEVLDWGGSGKPIVLLSGAGNNAHVFDAFAPKLTDRYHVYAITRRGFAPSSIPTSGYLADSLGDDVLAVLDSLRLERPVLIGHSIAGEELSSIGSRHPERVAGLVYLEAANPYAFYDPAQDNATIVIPDVQRQLAVIFDRWAEISFAERAAKIRALTDSTLPILTRDLKIWAANLEKNSKDFPNRPTNVHRDPVAAAIFGGAQRYTKINGPVLAIFAAPRQLPRSIVNDSVASARADSESLAGIMPQIIAFQRGVPQARVVQIAHATHYVFVSNEADVLREIRTFIDALPKK